VLHHLGADILARWDTRPATETLYTAGRHQEEFYGDTPRTNLLVTSFNRYPPHTDHCRRTFETPYGTLHETWTYSHDAGADFISEYWWKDWSEYPAVRYMLESTEFVFHPRSSASGSGTWAMTAWSWRVSHSRR